jgi:LacI family transcriptional regulator
MAKRPHVALLIESSRGYGRGLLHGVADYVRVHGPWAVHLQRHHRYDAPPFWLKNWRGDGVIARVENRRIAKAIRKLGLPAVDLRGRVEDSQMPAILTDDEAGACMAAQHLLERGFQHYAYCGYIGITYSDTRSQTFEREIEKAGFRCHIYDPPARLRASAVEGSEQQGLIHEEDVARWLRGLPKPAGLMACNDMRGQQVLNACRDAGIAVPDQVAVVGVDNDDVVCDLCDPPLTSVVPNTRKIGFDAAALLDRMMAGEPIAPSPIYVPPLSIVTRRSTDVLAIEDPDIAAAVRYIRDHACEGINVEDVLSRIPVSCSALERQFAKILGRSPKAEIIRVQIDHVKRLLGEPGLSLKEIAAKTGFSHPEYLCAVFKHRVGKTPGQYRTQVQQRKETRAVLK